MRDIESFIGELREAGSPEDQGEFTVDAHAAREKLATFQLPKPEYWILKIIQAAVAYGAEEVQIEIETNETTISFSTAETPEAEAIYRKLGLVSAEDSGLYHLTTGILGGIFDSKSDLRWSTLSPQGTQTVTLSPGQSDLIESQERPRIGAGSRLRVQSSRLTPSKTIGNTLLTLFRDPEDKLSHENSPFTKKMRFSPIPILINGKLIYRGPRQDQGYEGILQNFLQMGLVAPHDGINRLAPMPEQKGFVRDHDFEGEHSLRIQESTRGEEPFASFRTGRPLSAFLNLSQNQKGTQSSVMFVCDGILVDRIPLNIGDEPDSRKCPVSYSVGMLIPCKLLLELVIVVDSTQLDLSHFSVRNPGKLVEELLDPHFSLVLDCLKATTPDLHKAYHDYNPGIRDIFQKLRIVKPRDQKPRLKSGLFPFFQSIAAQNALKTWIPHLSEANFSERLLPRDSFKFPE